MRKIRIFDLILLALMGSAGSVAARPLGVPAAFTYDATGRGNDLENHGGTQVLGNPGNAVHLAAASSQYLDRASTSDLSPGGIFTIVAWLKLASFPAIIPAPIRIVGKANNLGQKEFQITVRQDWIDEYQVECDIFTDGSTPTSMMIDAWQGGPPPEAGTWSFMACGTDGEFMFMQVDNSPLKKMAFTGAPQSGTDRFTIGAAGSPFSNFVDGSIDGIGMWKGRALTAGDLTTLYNSRHGLAWINFDAGLRANLTAYYDFETRYRSYLPFVVKSNPGP